ncbi:MAG: response regulator transcription factor [Pseudomonadota bacterium]
MAKQRPSDTVRLLAQVAGYGLVLALGAFALEWLDYQHLVRQLSRETYVVVIAILFTVLGLWAGRKLTRTPAGPTPPPLEIARRLGVTRRECEVLALLAEGQTNKEIARNLGMSPNTVKTHLSRLFEKLDAQRRTQAVQRARKLLLIP